MKRFIIIISAILAIICFTGCPSPENSSDDDVEVTNSDWLFVLYMDADNNLNDSLWADVANEQLALTYRDGDETFPNVKIVMLWDGQDAAGAEADGNTRIHPRSEIYELGPADQATIDKVLSKDNPDLSWLMSNFSKRLTDEADWLEKEPDMGDVNTLKNFLSWVNERYSAKYKVLLLSDHGAGTDIEMISGGVAQPPRSLCTDDSHTDAQGRSKLLTAIDVKNAIAKSGLKPNIIYMDCCLQGNVETAYILRGSADYLVTSANTSYSNNHFAMLGNLSVNSTPRDFAQVIVTSYATAHADHTLEISEERNHASFEETLTQAAYDISEKKQTALYNAMNNLANVIKAHEKGNKKIFDNYLKQDYKVTANCKGMAYNGTYFTLNDIGYFCQNLIDDKDKCVQYNTIIDPYAKKVIAALDDVIVCSWMGKKTPGDANFYYTKNVTIYDENGQKLESEYTDADGQFGLTIATESPNGGNGFLTYVEDGTDYYQAFFGYSKIWGELYKYWLSDDND